MIKHFLKYIVFIFMYIFYTTISYSQNIIVNVYEYRTNNHVNNATIKFKCNNAQWQSGCITNNGLCTLNNITSGIYCIKALKQGYESAEKPNIDMSSSRSITITLYLVANEYLNNILLNIANAKKLNEHEKVIKNYNEIINIYKTLNRSEMMVKYEKASSDYKLNNKKYLIDNSKKPLDYRNKKPGLTKVQTVETH